MLHASSGQARKQKASQMGRDVGMCQQLPAARSSWKGSLPRVEYPHDNTRSSQYHVTLI